MPTPRVPTGFKPVAAGYTIGAPDGVVLSEVAGGMPRIAGDWSRGKQPIQLGRVMPADEFMIFTLWFQRIALNGQLQFLVPLDTGLGLQDHLCIMKPGSYSAVPLAGRKYWSVSFSVIAESSAYALSDEEVASTLAMWEDVGPDMGALLLRLARFATEDTLVLAP
jgi:hypothetical protein